MKRTYIILLFVFIVLSSCKKDKCDCSGANGISPDFTTGELCYVPILVSNETLIFKSNLNDLDTFIVLNHQKCFEEPDCPSYGVLPSNCCICPIDNMVFKDIAYNNMNYTISMRFSFYKDKDKYSKNFRLNEKSKESLSDNIFLEMSDTLIVNNIIYNDIYVFTVDTNSYIFQQYNCKISKAYFSKERGLVKYNEINDIAWNRIN